MTEQIITLVATGTINNVAEARARAPASLWKSSLVFRINYRRTEYAVVRVTVYLEGILRNITVGDISILLVNADDGCQRQYRDSKEPTADVRLRCRPCFSVRQTPPTSNLADKVFPFSCVPGFAFHLRRPAVKT